MLKNLKDYSGAWKKGLSTVFMLGLVAVSLFAQPKDNAPYSRFGLGEPVNHSLSSAGFGGLTAAYVDPLHINLQNPASLGSLVSATFEFGMYGERSKLELGGQSTKAWSGNLSHISLAFPMRNPLTDLLSKKERKVFWGMNIALLPNTSVGYDIQTEQALAEGDTILNKFQGTGGTNKLVWGNGVRYKNFSLGMNIAYLFGQLETLREVTFLDRVGVFGDVFQDDIAVRGLVFSFGAQYKLDLDKTVGEDGVERSNKSLIFGLYGNPSSNFTTKSSVLRIAEKIIPGNIESDTLLNEPNRELDGKLPSELTLGVMYQHREKLRVGVEYSFAKWGSYENEAKPDEQLFDSNRFSVGAEYSPNASSYNNYFQRLRYRAGFYYRQDPRLEDLNQYALTMGLGLPIVLPRQQTSFVNVAVELGRYETPDAINENFVKLSLGFTLNDSGWFYKRKFR